ncbi:type I secretion system membrane fusion protein PrsE [Variibacter gotjawalensis]|uniref:Membrane fusion protein (MFP) family protein n=1 Tax=Variibacter gotjawalensis TaxID=1333996 RepID=A0A0S3PZK8_9BRAD|nr:HlyD family type I secretion periplasmic adaptor subunit [Variibacter gotjawalensis]NIK47193.1 HlyD family secretion protein [Variibacter gotjawalensis]RZS49093.1 HlyD family secretion protein [Variibacter gotjawalensis]BAT61355.1 type I secretion system membrane fusion protein PrsE [Variibacter gotjawalensis]
MSEPVDPKAAIRRLNIIGLTTVLLVVGGVGGWAATTHIAGAVIAPGTLVVESNVKKVQHNTGGIVGEIFVREGSTVKAGELVVRLDDTLPRATLGIVQSQLDVLVAREARLVAERDGAKEITFDPAYLARRKDLTVDSAILGEVKLFEARRSGREGQRSQLRERITQTENEIRGLTAQQEAKEKEITFIGEELAGVQGLYKKNLVTIVRYNALQRDQARLQGERGQLVAEQARARGKIAETEIQIIQLEQDFRTEVLRDLREAQSKMAELQERVNAAQDELRRIDIRSPQNGTVHQLAVHTVGGVVQRGETLMLVVPVADALLVEAKAAPTDVDQIHVGAQVHIKVSAGNRRLMQDLDGKVRTISADLTREQVPGQSGAVQAAYYLVRIDIDPDQAKKLQDLQLIAGMQTEVYIRTENRLAVDYLIKPLTEQFARTFRER